MTQLAIPAVAEAERRISPADLLEFLIEANLVQVAEAVDGRIVIRDLSRRHRNFAVLVLGRSGFFVKQGVGSDRKSLIAEEAQTYAALSNSRCAGAAAALLPRFVLHDKERGLLILELLRGFRTLEDEIARQLKFADPSPALISFGAALGALHTLDPLSIRGPKPPQFRPFAFQILRPTLRSLREMSAADLEVIRIVQQSAELRESVLSLEAGWEQSRLIHGDLRSDNCRFRAARASRSKDADCRLVDWETAGLGPPWWDFGCLIAEFIAMWLCSSPLNKSMPPEQFLSFARLPIERLHSPIATIWSGYRQQLGLAGSDADRFLAKAVEAAGARLIQVAYERLQRAQRLSTEAVYILQLAANLFRSSQSGMELVGLANA